VYIGEYPWNRYRKRSFRNEPGCEVSDASRAEATLHLSEHHGDGTPGSVVWIAVGDVFSWHAELSAKRYRDADPGRPEDGPSGQGFELADPSGNVLRFAQPK
jgi:hypothetical protein